MPDSLREYLCAVPRVLNAKIPDETRLSTMRNVWDFREIGLLKMLFSDAAAMSHYMQSFRTVVLRAIDSYTAKC